jgi:hypothetical protein
MHIPLWLRWLWFYRHWHRYHRVHGVVVRQGTVEVK